MNKKEELFFSLLCKGAQQPKFGKCFQTFSWCEEQCSKAHSFRDALLKLLRAQEATPQQLKRLQMRKNQFKRLRVFYCEVCLKKSTPQVRAQEVVKTIMIFNRGVLDPEHDDFKKNYKTVLYMVKDGKRKLYRDLCFFVQMRLEQIPQKAVA